MAQPNVVSVTSIYAQSVGFNLGSSLMQFYLQWLQQK